MLRIALLALALATGCVASPAEPAGKEAAPAASAAVGDLLVVKMHADWCTKCRAMDPAYLEAKAALEERGYGFFVMDFTDTDTTAASFAEAAGMGLEELLEPHRGSTGFLLLVDTRGATALGVVHHTATAAEMIAAVESASSG